MLARGTHGSLDRPPGRPPGGQVINIASISGLIANRGVAGRHYETAKAAVLHFTRVTAADSGRRTASCCQCHPARRLHDGTEPALGARATGHHHRLQGANPDGRDSAVEEDLGPLAVCWPARASRYMTGAALVIDQGGYTLW